MTPDFHGKHLPKIDNKLKNNTFDSKMSNSKFIHKLINLKTSLRIVEVEDLNIHVNFYKILSTHWFLGWTVKSQNVWKHWERNWRNHWVCNEHNHPGENLSPPITNNIVQTTNPAKKDKWFYNITSVDIPTIFLM